jgi:hypothetical protein
MGLIYEPRSATTAPAVAAAMMSTALTVPRAAVAPAMTRSGVMG